MWRRSQFSKRSGSEAVADSGPGVMFYPCAGISSVITACSSRERTGPRESPVAKCIWNRSITPCAIPGSGFTLQSVCARRRYLAVPGLCHHLILSPSKSPESFLLLLLLLFPFHHRHRPLSSPLIRPSLNLFFHYIAIFYL